MMSVEQQLSNAVQACNNLTAAINGKVAEIDQHMEQNTQKVDAELAKIQTKLPRIVITQNQRLKPAEGQTYPSDFSIGGGVDSEVFEYIEGNPSARDAAQIALLQEISADTGLNMRENAYYREGFYIFKLSWSTGNNNWLAYPRPSDNPTLLNIPLNTFFTAGALVKVLSGSVSQDAWAKGNQLGKWAFCNSKYEPSGFGEYVHLHPYRRTETGEVLIALPAVITGHIDSGANWFPNIVLS